MPRTIVTSRDRAGPLKLYGFLYFRNRSLHLAIIILHADERSVLASAL